MPSSCSRELLTLTVLVDTLEEGWLLIRRALRKFRRRVIGRWMTAGTGQIEWKPSRKDPGKWWVHAHLAVVAEGEVPTDSAMTAAWQELLVDVEGHVHRSLKREPLLVAARSGGLYSPLAGYVTKRKRRALLKLTDEQLEEVALSIPGRSWWVRPFGRWRVPHPGASGNSPAGGAAPARAVAAPKVDVARRTRLVASPRI